MKIRIIFLILALLLLSNCSAKRQIRVPISVKNLCEDATTKHWLPNYDLNKCIETFNMYDQIIIDLK